MISGNGFCLDEEFAPRPFHASLLNSIDKGVSFPTYNVPFCTGFISRNIVMWRLWL